MKLKKTEFTFINAVHSEYKVVFEEGNESGVYSVAVFLNGTYFHAFASRVVSKLAAANFAKMAEGWLAENGLVVSADNKSFNFKD